MVFREIEGGETVFFIICFTNIFNINQAMNLMIVLMCSIQSVCIEKVRKILDYISFLSIIWKF